ncbi:CAT RNA binding domain-containing protein, partial [Streptococcus hyovaginalis]
MNVWKVINNNIVLSRNDDDQEVVIMGKGLGFKKKAGDAIDESKIENMYLSSKEWSVNKLTQMLSSIPLVHIQGANEIISFSKVSLGKKLNENKFLT